jgi:dTDP-4-amino-4,6-dideoxygalactose transaminase
VTSDDALAARLRRLRNGGQSDRYRHPEFGVNSRLDEIQAAVLRVRLERLPAWTARRRALAARYRTGLVSPAVRVPPAFDAGHVYHLFPVLTERRDALMAHLTAHGIGSLIHYPIPIPRQPGIATPRRDGCPVADRVCAEICSLPLHPHLSDADADRVIQAVQAWDPMRSHSA